ncbi:hypothetical protein [Alkalimonas mucilaginosa]|uniref:Uncharacterized protein n=1 Tax=Alkalimonas mucilaginosa TaxID=3057676 RepID=A0ABU7JIG9_9GAMM|nr:hypothetical protein [Alkalimonas sp. MEB004]MEE2025455.1 hypothetical protein [Alkalimonas sp. MEB004]
MIVRIFFLSFGLLLLSFRGGATEWHQVIACDNCSESAARALVNRKATLSISCEALPGHHLERGSRACYSQPGELYVLNLHSGQSYAFYHYHSGQGGEAGDLQLHIQARPVAAGLRQLLKDFSDSVGRYTLLLREISHEARLDTLQSSPLHQVTTASAGGCPAGNPTERAIEAALSHRVRAQLQYGVQQRFNQALASGRYRSVQGAFERLSITSVGAQASKGGLGLSVTWERRVQGATQRYVFEHEHVVPPSSDGPWNEVAFFVNPDENGNIVVNLAAEQTYIEGFLFQDIMAGGGQFSGDASALLSDCAKMAFINALAKTTGSFSQRPTRGGNLVPTSPDRIGVGPNLDSCTVYFYDSRGELLYVFPNMKCN